MNQPSSILPSPSTPITSRWVFGLKPLTKTVVLIATISVSVFAKDPNPDEEAPLFAIDTSPPAALIQTLQQFPKSCIDTYSKIFPPDFIKRARRRDFPVHTLIVETKDGPVFISGSEKAIPHVDLRAANLKPAVQFLCGASNEHFTVASGIIGSLSRYALMKTAGDLDIEALLVAKNSTPLDYQRPGSKLNKQLTRFLVNHIESTIKSRPDVRFIELKAGEIPADSIHTDPQPIKWWLRDIRAGFKMVDMPGKGKVKITLSVALAQNARVKIDWAIPSVLSHSLPGAYMEASVLYRLAAQQGNNPIQLKTDSDGRSLESLPFRVTVITFDLDDLQLLNEASLSAESLPLEFVHYGFIKAILKDSAPDQLKNAKRAFSLLQFWDSVHEFNLHLKNSGKPSTTLKDLENSLLTIIRSPEIVQISEDRSQLKLLKYVQEHEETLPQSSVFLSKLAERYKLTGFETMTLSDLIKKVSDQIDLEVERRIEKHLKEHPMVKIFIDWILQRTKNFPTSPLHFSTFIAMKPSAELIKSYRALLPVWKERYPHLQFHHPEDLHLTIKFLGRVPEASLDFLSAEIQSTVAKDNALQSPLFQNGVPTIIGRKQDVLALRYTTSSAVVNWADRLRRLSAEHGSLQDRDYPDFTPHITLGWMDSEHLEQAQKEAQRFLEENFSLLKQWNGSNTTIWRRIPGSSGGPKTPGAEPEYELFK